MRLRILLFWGVLLVTFGTTGASPVVGSERTRNLRQLDYMPMLMEYHQQTVGESRQFFTYPRRNYDFIRDFNKTESSAIFRPGYRPFGTVTDEDLTPTGKWVREVIRGTDPAAIPSPAALVKKSRVKAFISGLLVSIGERGWNNVSNWWMFAVPSALLVFLASFLGRTIRRRPGSRIRSYDDLYPESDSPSGGHRFAGGGKISRLLLPLSVTFTLIYLCWRAAYSVPVESGPAAVTANLLLLAVEIVGFSVTILHFWSIVNPVLHLYACNSLNRRINQRLNDPRTGPHCHKRNIHKEQYEDLIPVLRYDHINKASCCK